MRRDDHRNEERCTESIRVRACAGERIITAARKRSYRERSPSQIPPPQTPLRGVEPKRATCVLETGLRMRGRALTSVPPGLPWRSLRLGCSYVAPILPAPSMCVCMRLRGHAHTAYMHEEGQSQERGTMCRKHSCARVRGRENHHTRERESSQPRAKDLTGKETERVRTRERERVGSSALVKSPRRKLRCAGWSQNGQHVY